MRVSRGSYDSKFFHVMVQGIRKERIFEDDNLKEKFIEYIKKGSERHQIEILAYCIMGNHAHILVYTEEISKLSKMMHFINMTYAHKYNKTNKRCGYVFRDRYKSEMIMTQAHLKNCIRYIHNNPVKANICRNCEDYKYSTYKEYLNGRMNSEIYKEYIGNDYNVLLQEHDCAQNRDIFLDVDDEFDEKPIQTAEMIIKEFCKKKQITQSKMPREALRDLVKILANRYSVSKKEIQEILGISKYMTYKLLSESAQINRPQKESLYGQVETDVYGNMK